ncbi:uncharacterized protein LOC123307835 isoform X2 [Coccinella septempunctata]|uniref:uncharacterized protein LOC123307835 isoform X2 n=1 Tax=Coccinella septempunctata TaxID=41139 RepID=UPI001D0917DA|nr:uncharacterized protein LOC123307835 isoform X2 [Coccinella septempunctata]
MSSKKKSSKQQKHQAKESKKANGDKVSIKILLLLSFTILGLVIFTDVQRHGSWKDSVLANLLKDYHVCEYSHKVLNKTSEGIRWINSEIDKQFPGYEKKLHETLEPYSELISDLGIISYKLLSNAKESVIILYGNLLTKIEEYAPGLLDQTADGLRNTLNQLTIYSKKSLKYLREEVFVGNLAPEYMGKVIIDLMNNGIEKVNEFYVWGYEKVRTVIK